jgi:hypothetical protein
MAYFATATGINSGRGVLALPVEINDIIHFERQVFAAKRTRSCTATRNNSGGPELPREINPFWTARLLDCQCILQTQYPVEKNRTATDPVENSRGAFLIPNSGGAGKRRERRRRRRFAM